MSGINKIGKGGNLQRPASRSQMEATPKQTITDLTPAKVKASSRLPTDTMVEMRLGNPEL
jgi:hypothetical protein